MQIKAQWEKRDKKTKSVKDMEYSKRPNIHVIGVPEEKGKNGVKNSWRI